MAWIVVICVILLLFFIAIFGCAVMLFWVIRARGADLPSGATQFSERVYFGRRYLLSRGEAAFYRVLVLAVAGEYVVMAKVRLSDLVDAKSAERRIRANAFNRLCRKHADFVLLDARDLTVRLVIELDDKSHMAPSRQTRDEFVDDVLREGGLPVLHVRAATGYSPQGLLAQVRGAVAG